MFSANLNRKTNYPFKANPNRMKISKPSLATCLRISLFVFLLSLLQPISAQRMRANLLIVDNTGATLMDGNMTNYGAQFSNAIDGYDIWKMSNFGENFGILRSTANLVIERRSLIVSTDTTYFRMWNVQVRNYRIQVIAENLHTSNLFAFVRDKFLGTDTPINLNDTTDVNFSVTTAAGSYAQDRFKLIYSSVASATLPVQFTGVQLQLKTNGLQVLWTVENEFAMDRYVIEHSINGSVFESLQENSAHNNGLKNDYAVLTTKPAAGMHFYRVKGISLSGKVQYSAVVRMTTDNDNTANLEVYPNPVANKLMNVTIETAAAGNYSMSLVKSNGQLVKLPGLKLNAGIQQQTIKLPTFVLPGIYRLVVTAPDGQRYMQTVNIL